MAARLLLALVIAAGCSPGRGAAPEPPAPAAGCEGAQACQAGCDGGRLADCHQLAWLKIGARGTALDLAGASRLLARACAGELVRACGLAAWLEASDGRDLAAARRAELDRSCRAGDGWSCAALASWALRPASPDGRARDAGAGASWAELGCAAGHLWSCTALEVVLGPVRPAPDWTAAMRERHARLLALARDRRRSACAAGEREGCAEGSPEYAAQVRKDCAAGDGGACAEVAHTSQSAPEAMRAAELACERGKISSACGLTCNGLRDGALGAPDLAAARACYQRACAAGEELACRARDAGPLLGGGCAAIDMTDQPHLELTALPRLTGPRHGGGSFDSARAERRPRLYLFTASWNRAGRLADLAPLAAELAPLGVELVAVLSDTSWQAAAGLGEAGSFVAVLDPPAPGQTIGRQTAALGITKVPEGLLVDPDGAVRRHVVGPGLLTSRLNSRRCAEQVLKRP